jgi:TPR repeat protein
MVVTTDALFRIGDAAEEAGDFDLALRSFERGSDLGSSECIARLAYLYDEGVGVEVDKPLAMKLYRRAWRLNGSLCAANNIAILYREVDRYREMFRWFQRAAENGDDGAQLQLAKCYLEGVGVRKNVQSALRCLVIAEGGSWITEYEREEARALLDVLGPRLV